MTDNIRDDDELEFDDNEFVLEDVDLDEQFEAIESGTAPADPRTQPTPSPWQPGSADAARAAGAWPAGGHEHGEGSDSADDGPFANPGPPFDDTAPTAWEGAGADLEDFGISTSEEVHAPSEDDDLDSDPFEGEDQFELVEDFTADGHEQVEFDPELAGIWETEESAPPATAAESQDALGDFIEEVAEEHSAAASPVGAAGPADRAWRTDEDYSASEDFAAASASNYSLDDHETVGAADEEATEAPVGGGFGMGREMEVAFGGTPSSAEAEAYDEGAYDEPAYEEAAYAEEPSTEERYRPEEWSDVSLGDTDAFKEDVDDPLYGDDGQEPYEEEYEDEPSFREYEDSYVDVGEDQPQVVGGARGGRRGFAWSAAASLAAVLLIAGAGAVALVRPEWVGLTIRPVLIDDIAIGRPDLTIDLTPPEMSEAPTADPVAATDLDPTTDPTQPPVEPTDPTPEVVSIEPPTGDANQPPADRDPIADPTPDRPAQVADVLPGVPGPPGTVWTNHDAAAPVTPAVEPADDAVVVGENLIVSRGATPEPVPVPEFAKGVTPGYFARATLPNEAVFVGVVRKLEADAVVLELEGDAEIRLAFRDLASLKPAASTDEPVRVDKGYVRLHNLARIDGAILDTENDEEVTLKIDGGVIAIPRDTIDRVGASGPGGVEVARDATDDREWLREKVREMLSRGR